MIVRSQGTLHAVLAPVICVHWMFLPLIGCPGGLLGAVQ